MRHGPIWGMGMAIAIALAITAYYKLNAKNNETSPFTVATITAGDIVQTVTSTGQLTPRVVVEISSQISGLVTEVNADFNAPVRRGQILARIDPSTYRQRVQQAQADLLSAESSEKLAQLKARRAKGLFEQKVLTEQEFEEIDAQLTQAKATLALRRAQLENARVDLERCTITSPINGIVIFRQIEVGKTIVSSFSAPTLFVIAQDLSKMRVITPISEVDVWSVKEGQPVTFTVDALPNKRFDGALTQIRNPYTPSDRTAQAQQQPQSAIAAFDGVIEVDNSELLLRPGLTATVSIIVAKREKALRIPNGALRVALPEGVVPTHSATAESKHTHPTATVYRLAAGTRQGTPEAVVVELGVSDSLVTEILSGLKEGDIVITGLATPMEVQKRDGLLG